MRRLVHRPVPAAPKVWIKSGVDISIPTICRQSSPPEFAALQLRWFIDPSYALLSDPKGAQTSNASSVRSNSEGSSFSGLFTRVEMGHIVIGSDG
jgi:hypothetical protein